MRKFNRLLTALLLCLATASCNDDKCGEPIIREGEYNRLFMTTLSGFPEQKNDILSELQLADTTFIRLSTDSAWSLSPVDRDRLVAIRSAVSRPSAGTLLQKVIPLEDIATYMNNVYGGTVGGFVCQAADVKSLSTMAEVYDGLRLDYDGTKFARDGAGYAVIRFYSEATAGLTIPYSPELGGTQPHEWPNGGGGFTTSKLGQGGYPEWVMTGYTAPCDGAELYEVTPEGREILRSVYSDGRWQTYESGYYPLPSTRSYRHTPPSITYADYDGHTYLVRGLIDGSYHLRTFTPTPQSRVIEKGVWGLEVPASEVSNVRTVQMIG